MELRPSKNLGKEEVALVQATSGTKISETLCFFMVPQLLNSHERNF
jgi:hypothetical protein